MFSYKFRSRGSAGKERVSEGQASEGQGRAMLVFVCRGEHRTWYVIHLHAIEVKGNVLNHDLQGTNKTQSQL